MDEISVLAALALGEDRFLFCSVTQDIDLRVDIRVGEDLGFLFYAVQLVV